VYLKYHNEHYEAIIHRGTVNPNQEKLKYLLPTIEDIGSESGAEFEYDKNQYSFGKQTNYTSLNKTDLSGIQKSKNECKDSVPKQKLSPVPTDFMYDIGMEEDERKRKYEESEDENDLFDGNKICKSTHPNQKWLPHRNFEQSESDIDDPHFPLPSKPSTQEASTDCIDLTSDFSESQTTDSSTSTTLPSFPEKREKPGKYRKDTINEHLMAKIEPKLVDEVPWDIDGNCKYIVKCSSQDWIKRTKDGRWFMLKNSGRRSTSLYRKVGHCQGSYICYYDQCPKRTYENTINRIDFKHERD